MITATPLFNMTAKSGSGTPVKKSDESGDTISHKLELLGLSGNDEGSITNDKSSQSEVSDVETPKVFNDPSKLHTDKSDTEISGNQINSKADSAVSNLKSDTDNLDTKTFRLLDLLDTYEKLINGPFRSSFVDGFLDLSRANYHGTQRFNMDSIDLRPRQATAIVGGNDEAFKLVDRWEEHQIELKKKSEAQDEKKIDVHIKDSEKKKEDEKHEKGSKDKSVNSQKIGITSALNSKKGLRNRKQDNPAKRTESEVSRKWKTDEDDFEKESTEPSLKNPLYQFGRMVPLQLQSAQNHFKLALSNSVKLIEIQREISSLVVELS